MMLDSLLRETEFAEIVTTKDIKLELNSGVELRPTERAGVCSVKLIDESERFNLPWDRFVRLNKTALAISKFLDETKTVLDVGGFDGALAMFLPNHKIDVVDPATTSGTVFSVSEKSYDSVVSIDALEHIEPAERSSFLSQVCRVARGSCFINFPTRGTKASQAFVLELTNNPLIREHVEWVLPDAAEVKKHLESAGFKVEIQKHTSLSQWVSQFILQTNSPEVASKVSRHLLENFINEPVGTTLYDLVIAKKSSLQSSRETECE